MSNSSSDSSDSATSSSSSAKPAAKPSPAKTGTAAPAATAAGAAAAGKAGTTAATSRGGAGATPTAPATGPPTFASESAKPSGNAKAATGADDDDKSGKKKKKKRKRRTKAKEKQTAGAAGGAPGGAAVAAAAAASSSSDAEATEPQRHALKHQSMSLKVPIVASAASASTDEPATDMGLFSLLSEELLFRVLQFCTGRDMCRWSRINKTWHARLTQPDFWFKMCIHEATRCPHIAEFVRDCGAEDFVKGVRTAIRGQYQGTGVVVENIPWMNVYFSIFGPYATNETPVRCAALWKEGDEAALQRLVDSELAETSSFEELVALVTSPNLAEEKCEPLMEFLCGMHREFVNPLQFWTMLRLRFSKPVIKALLAGGGYIQMLGAIRRRVVMLIAQWLELFFEDDVQQLPELVISLKAFLKFSFLAIESVDLRQHIGEFLCVGSAGTVTSWITPYTSKDDLHSFAFHLALIEQQLFAACCRSEFAQMGWTLRDKEARSPNILRFVQWFNAMALRVSNDVLSNQHVDDRADCVANYIRLVKFLFDLHAYNACQEIITGLTSTELYRLQHTWDLVPGKLFKVFEDIMEALSLSRNCVAVRSILRPLLVQSNEPVVPYLGMYLTDLSFVAEGNAMAGKGAVNVKRLRLQFKTMAEIITFQARPRYQAPKGVVESVEVQTYLKATVLNSAVEWVTETERSARSLEVEPRGTTDIATLRKQKRERSNSTSTGTLKKGMLIKDGSLSAIREAEEGAAATAKAAKTSKKKEASFSQGRLLQPLAKRRWLFGLGDIASEFPHLQ